MNQAARVQRMNANLIRDILQRTDGSQPESVFCADQQTDSGTVKGDLSKFLKAVASQGTTVSGNLLLLHRARPVRRDEFYYLFSDYHGDRLNQTTLTNSELDGMLKTLSPQPGG